MHFLHIFKCPNKRGSKFWAFCKCILEAFFHQGQFGFAFLAYLFCNFKYLAALVSQQGPPVTTLYLSPCIGIEPWVLVSVHEDINRVVVDPGKSFLLIKRCTDEGAALLRCDVLDTPLNENSW